MRPLLKMVEPFKSDGARNPVNTAVWESLRDQADQSPLPGNAGPSACQQIVPDSSADAR